MRGLAARATRPYKTWMHSIQPVYACNTVSSISTATNNNRVQEQAKKWHRRKQQEETGNYLSISVDRSSLRQPTATSTNRIQESLKSTETALVHLLRSMIEVKGPLTVAEFMQRVRRSDCWPLDSMHVSSHLRFV
jgi:hypothetical protein